MRRIAGLLLIAPALAGAGEPVREAGFLGEFVSARESVAPGETVDVALRIRHDPGFHTYWRAPGIVGVPTEIKWTETGGLRPGEIQWPQPQVVKMGPYDAYGYEGEVFLVVPFTAPKDASPGSGVDVSARVSFMVCPAVLSSRATCHPGFVDIHHRIAISAGPSRPTRWSGPIEAARASMATPNREWLAEAKRGDKEIILELRPERGANPAIPKHPHFFSSDGQVHSDSEQRVTRRKGGGITMTLEISEFGPQEPKHLRGILFTATGLPDGSGARPIEFRVPYPKR